jgi:mannose-6-phosphate isomerase-like protein (cupin superfamily)
MKHWRTGSRRRMFDVLGGSRHAQAAMMTLQPGETSDDELANEHAASEQWLFVISGAGQATVGRTRKRLRRIALHEHSLLWIAKRELHQIRNTGRKPLIALNVYVPPAYDGDGEPKA